MFAFENSYLKNFLKIIVKCAWQEIICMKKHSNFLQLLLLLHLWIDLAHHLSLTYYIDENFPCML